MWSFEVLLVCFLVFSFHWFVSEWWFVWPLFWSVWPLWWSVWPLCWSLPKLPNRPLKHTSDIPESKLWKDSLHQQVVTLPETNIAIEHHSFWWYLPGNLGISCGYVSLTEGKCPGTTFQNPKRHHHWFGGPLWSYDYPWLGRPVVNKPWWWLERPLSIGLV